MPGSVFEPKNLGFLSALPLTSILSYFGLGLIPIPLLSLFDLPLILFLVRNGSPLYILTLFFFLALSIGLSFCDFSSSPLDSPFDNIGVLISIGALVAFLTILPTYIEKVYLRRYGQSSFFLFAGLWVSTWLLWRRFSPFGSWGDWAYTLQGDGNPLIQLASVFGLSGIDFVLAWWAHIGATLLADSLNNVNVDDGSNQLNERTSLLSPESQAPAIRQTSRKIVLSAIALLFIYSWGAKRLNQIESNIEPLKTLKVACLLAAPSIKDSPLEEMIHSTKDLATRAKIILWSESAVNLDSTTALDNLLNETMVIAKKHIVYVGITYTVPSGGHKRRNFLTLIDKDGSILFNYTKTHPVPIAEGYSTEAGPGELPLKEINVPTIIKKISVPLNVSAAICFDMDFPKLLQQAGEANLVLSPAQTWGSRVGLEHLHMASVRAIEQGFWLLRCDAGGVSGIVDDLGRIRNWQVAPKSGVSSLIWDLPLTDSKRETLYSTYGDIGSLVLILIVCALEGLTRFANEKVESFEDKVEKIWNENKGRFLEWLPRSPSQQRQLFV
ncbi:hypothetical protein G9A89_013627 [Geosiphon pyriformis]|nr:hypothetical protein G9A89_013627 [Geosiphon pyriformis]